MNASRELRPCIRNGLVSAPDWHLGSDRADVARLALAGDEQQQTCLERRGRMSGVPGAASRTFHRLCWGAGPMEGSTTRVLGTSSQYQHFSASISLCHKWQLVDALYTEQLDQALSVMLSMQGLSNASTDHFFERILDDIREQQNAASDLLSQLSPYSLDQSEEVFVRLLRRMERKQLLLVLVIDEFESAFQNPLFNQAFFDRLRAYAQDWRLAYLLATQKSVDFRP